MHAAGRLPLRLAIATACLALPLIAVGLPAECSFSCKLGAPKPNCPATARVADLGQWIGQPLSAKACANIRVKLDKAGLCARLVPRPHVESGVLLTTNPHPRHDAHVCPGHEVRLYVGVRPWIEMPDFRKRSADDALGLLTKAWGVPSEHRSGVPFEARCLHGGARLDAAQLPHVKVEAQWPLASQPLYGLQESLVMDRLHLPRQTAVVWVTHPGGSAAARDPATLCPQPLSLPQATSEVVAEVRTQVVETPSSPWWLPALGGAGAAAAAGALLRSAGRSAPLPGPPLPTVPTQQPRVVARVRIAATSSRQGDPGAPRSG